MNKQSYGLFRRLHGTKKWERVGDLAFPLDKARHVFQNQLISMSLGGEYEPRLRPVKK
jgi:hypothetical protein